MRTTSSKRSTGTPDSAEYNTGPRCCADGAKTCELTPPSTRCTLSSLLPCRPRREDGVFLPTIRRLGQRNPEAPRRELIPRRENAVVQTCRRLVRRAASCFVVILLLAFGRSVWAQDLSDPVIAAQGGNPTGML